MDVQFGVKEWAAVVEGLAQGKQIIMVRGEKPKPTPVPLLLYPTFSYFAGKSASLEKKFKPEYIEMARAIGEETMRQAHEESIVKIKYFAEVTDSAQVDYKFDWTSIEPYFIWKKEHTKDYALSRNSVYIWFVRVYKLPSPVVTPAKSSGSLTTYLHDEKIVVNELEPVLSDQEYTVLKNKMLARLPAAGKSKRSG